METNLLPLVFATAPQPKFLDFPFRTAAAIISRPANPSTDRRPATRDLPRTRHTPNRQQF